MCVIIFEKQKRISAIYIGVHMKTIKAVLLLILSLLFIFPLMSCNENEQSNDDQSPESEEFVYRLSDSGEISITRCKSTGENIVIPSTIDGNPVTSISEKAFFMNSTATEITVPSGVTIIGASAFEACSALKKINISSTVSYIGDMAFANCAKLKTVVVESNSALKQIGKNAFYHCNSLETNEYENTIYLSSGSNGHAILVSAVSPDITVAKIHPDTKIITATAFSKCTSLKEITIPENVEYIGDEAFYGCANLDMIYYNAIRLNDLNPGSGVFKLAATNSKTMTLQVGENVERIPAYLMDSANRFRILNFDDGAVCSEIGKGAFAGTPLKELTIPKSIKIIEDFAFYNCEWLDTVKLDAENLSDFADDNSIFAGAGVYAEIDITVTFGRTAKRIPANFLSTLDEIIYVKFENNNVTKSFGKNAFKNCNTIREVRVTSRKAWCESTFENEYSNPLRYGNALFYVNDKSVTEGFVLTEDIRFISDYAFMGYKNMEKIIIPKSVTYIGNNAFYGVENLYIIYWGGDAEGWNNLDIKDGNTVLGSSTIYHYWAKELGRPTVPGNYWYLDEEAGTPVKWLNLSGS